MIKQLPGICLIIITQALYSQNTTHMDWWREARFGLFIHWGLYAVPAGEWKGQKTPRWNGEWIMYDMKIPVKDYVQLTSQFNPVFFNADEWVSIAREAGMKYIVFTAKHHDGFAMYHSAVSNYNITDATPFRRDPLRELEQACKKQNIKLGIYYSQAQDWHHPGGAYKGITKGVAYWDSSIVRTSFDQYIHEKALPQIRELVDSYAIDLVWWDTPDSMTEAAAKKLIEPLKRKPYIIANNRLYRPWRGDFSTPEQYVPPTGLDYDWEVCMTMNNTWGYRKDDTLWKSSGELIRMLADIAGKGGNLLLNIGPDALGNIPSASKERLQDIAAWMKVNGESIHGTSAGPFFKLQWGRCTRKREGNHDVLYLHVFNWPAKGKLPVPGLKTKPLKCILLKDNTALPFSIEENGLVLSVPDHAPDMINTVIKLVFANTFSVVSNKPGPDSHGNILLPAYTADIHNFLTIPENQAILKSEKNYDYISNWKDNRIKVSWLFNSGSNGIFELWGTYRCAGNNKVTVVCDGEKQILKFPPAGDFNTVFLGRVEITKTTDNYIEFRSESPGWNLLEIQSILLKPVK